MMRRNLENHIGRSLFRSTISLSTPSSNAWHILNSTCKYFESSFAPFGRRLDRQRKPLCLSHRCQSHPSCRALKTNVNASPIHFEAGFWNLYEPGLSHHFLVFPWGQLSQLVVLACLRFTLINLRVVCIDGPPSEFTVVKSKRPRLHSLIRDWACLLNNLPVQSA